MITGYLDPASGSAIMGAVVAGAAGAGVAARTVMSKLRFRKLEAEESDPPVDDDTPAAGPVDEPTQ